VVQNSLAAAISLAFSNDRLLFGQGVKSERAIVFRVGQYLARIVETWEGDWVVDAEYGRWYPDEATLEQKILCGRAAIPDLVIHKRGTKQNLLVVEAKVHPVDDEKRWLDYAKLNGFLNDAGFRYRHAVFLEFHSRGPQRWLWVERTRHLSPDLYFNFDAPLEDVPNGSTEPPV
jgi:hypothetical protein